jgi:hypothetical protein
MMFFHSNVVDFSHESVVKAALVGSVDLVARNVTGDQIIPLESHYSIMGLTDLPLWVYWDLEIYSTMSLLIEYKSKHWKPRDH